MSADTATISEYRFRARPISGVGRVEKGKARASSESAVVNDLMSRGMVPLEVRSMEGGLNRSIHLGFGKPKPKAKSLVVACRVLATMLDSGMTLTSSLSRVTQQITDKPLLDAMRLVSRDVNGGQKFSAALSKHPHIFPAQMVHMVRAGEDAAFLEKAVAEIADTLESDYELRAEVRGAMVYPTVVTSFAILAAYGMIAFIVPVFAGIYTELSDGTAELPLLTRMLVSASHVAPWVGLAFLALVGPSVAYYRSVAQKPSVRSKVDLVKMRMPIFGKLLRKSALARFGSNFSQLLASGMDLDRALDVVRGTVGNYQMEMALQTAADAIRRRGQTLSATLEREKMFDPMIIGMIGAGESSGKVEEMVARAGMFYRAEVNRTVKALKSVLEPLLTAVMGSVVAVIIVGIYQPFLTLASVVQG